MQNPSSTFIVLEGSDGSGKGTQFRLLKERLQAVGYEVEVFDFPRYDEPSSYFVKKYLNGDYGPAESVSPYTASLFYALDRYEAAAGVRKALADGKVVLANRYTGSNMAHQGSKFADPIEQRGFFVWADSLEYQLLGIPRPSMNIFLRVPAETSYELIKQKAQRSYTDKSHDEHEANLEHLRRAVATYDTLCQLFPTDFKAIECTHEGSLMSIPEINNQIWQLIKPLLPAQPNRPGKSVTLNLNAPEPGTRPKAGSKEDQFSYSSNSMALADIAELQLAVGSKVKVELDWEKVDYDYAIPKQLPKKLYGRFEEILDSLGDKHKEALSKIRKSKSKEFALLTPSIPLAAVFPVTLTLDQDEALKLAAHLGAKPSAGLEDLASRLGSWLQQAGVKLPLSQPEPISQIIKKISEDHGANLSAQTERVQLTDTWPRNEFKLLVDVIYPHSSLSKEEIELELDRWSYQQKSDALLAAISSPASALAEQIKYSFDIIADQPTMLGLMGSGLIKDAQAQLASPRFGYDTPARLEELGIEDLYLEMFDKSLELYSALQAGDEELAPLATLAGHKRRWKCSLTLKQLLEVKRSGDAIYAEIINAISGAHPIIASRLSSSELKAEPTKPETKEPVKKKSRKRRHRGGRSKKS